MAYRSFWGGSGRLDTHLDTPPSINRRHLDSCLALLVLAAKIAFPKLKTPAKAGLIRRIDDREKFLDTKFRAVNLHYTETLFSVPIPIAIADDPRQHCRRPRPIDRLLHGLPSIRSSPIPPRWPLGMAPKRPCFDWRERLVCSRCGSREIDLVVTGTKL